MSVVNNCCSYVDDCGYDFDIDLIINIVISLVVNPKNDKMFKYLIYFVILHHSYNFNCMKN